MYQWVRRITVAVAALLAIFLAVGYFMSTGYTISRSVDIAADPPAIHRYVGDLEKWEAWSPWAEEDPTLVVTLGEKTSGVGANQSWIGEKSGTGSFEFTMSSPAKGIEYDLELQNGTYFNKCSILYESTDNGTRVVWTMEGDTYTRFMGGYLAMMYDSIIGKSFTRGLGKLKLLVEGNASVSP